MKKWIIILILLVFTYLPNKYTEATVIHATSEVVILTGKEAIEDTIRTTLSGLGVNKDAINLIVAQSKHESGNYENSLTKHNNIFARHYAKIDTLAISAGGKAEGHSRFAIYPSIKDATTSQYQYLKRKGYSFKWKTAKEYSLELKKKNYYEASISEYTNALNKFLNEK